MPLILKKQGEAEDLTAQQIHAMLRDTMPSVTEGSKKQKSDDDMKEDLTSIASGIVIQQIPGRTYVYAVAGAGGGFDERNKIIRLPAHGFHCIQNLVYEGVNDHFHCQGTGYVDLGLIPYIFEMKMKNVYAWQKHIPMPDDFIEEHLSPSKKESLAVFRNKHSKTSINFIQLIDN